MGICVVGYLRLSQMVVRISLGSLSDGDSHSHMGLSPESD